MLVIFRPQAFSARTADSRPGPGPLTRTSTILTPCSCAATPAFSAATCAANGVLLREPRKPQPPDVAHDNVLPWRSVIVTIVLLKDACTCAIASVTCFLTFLRPLAGAAAAPAAGAAAPPFSALSPCCFCSAIVPRQTCRVRTSRQRRRLQIKKLHLACRRIHLDRGLARALARARIRARALTAERQSTTMTDAAIAAEIHQSLDVHRDFA